MTFLCLKINHKEQFSKNILQDVLTQLHGLAYRCPVAPHWAAGFSSLIVTAGSRYFSVKRYFCARYSTLSRIMAGCGGEALRPAGICDASLLTPLQLATTFSSVLARLLKQSQEAANMAKSAQSQSQIVFLPYVCAVDPSGSEFHKMISGIEQDLLDRVKEALNEAGVAWIDIRTKERSQPQHQPADTDGGQLSPAGEVGNADSVEEAQDIRYAIRQRLYYGNTLTRTLYLSSVFICKNAAQQWADQNSQEHEPGRFTTQNDVTELTPQIVSEIRKEYGWDTPSTVYLVLPDDAEASDNAQ
ncbi:hypothetical protein J9M50_004091 [Salmonella enterica]|nr:hypothetical protein [Salmonella enterica]EHI9910498.1 hypothetical protein [Salmonella enterica]EHJ0909974.1 hypothetical protein [Salmonella enterica]